VPAVAVGIVQGFVVRHVWTTIVTVRGRGRTEGT